MPKSRLYRSLFNQIVFAVARRSSRVFRSRCCSGPLIMDPGLLFWRHRLLAYIIAWIIIPDANRIETSRHRCFDTKQRCRLRLLDRPKLPLLIPNQRHRLTVIGLILIGFRGSLHPEAVYPLEYLPLFLALLIIAGVFILVKR